MPKQYPIIKITGGKKKGWDISVLEIGSENYVNLTYLSHQELNALSKAISKKLIK